MITIIRKKIMHAEAKQLVYKMIIWPVEPHNFNKVHSLTKNCDY